MDVLWWEFICDSKIFTLYCKFYASIHLPLFWIFFSHIPFLCLQAPDNRTRPFKRVHEFTFTLIFGHFLFCVKWMTSCTTGCTTGRPSLCYSMTSPWGVQGQLCTFSVCIHIPLSFCKQCQGIFLLYQLVRYNEPSGHCGQSSYPVSFCPLRDLSIRDHGLEYSPIQKPVQSCNLALDFSQNLLDSPVLCIQWTFFYYLKMNIVW